MYIYLAFSLPNFHVKKKLKKKNTEQKTLQMVKAIYILQLHHLNMETSLKHLLNSSAR